MVTLGTVKWGGYKTNCTNGQVITPDLPFPCPCTQDVNNGGTCGKLNNITVIENCKINNGDGTCQVKLDMYNNNLESYTITGNSFSPALLSGTLLASIPPGYTTYAESLTWACPGGNGNYNRSGSIQQIFANY